MWRWFGRIIVLVIALLAIAALVPPIRDGIGNSWKLAILRRNMTNIKHYAPSEAHTIHSRVGILAGNGNHCDYFVAQVRTSPASQTDIEQHYAGVKLMNPITGKNESVELIFFESDDFAKNWLPYEFEDRTAWGIPPVSKNLTIYAVSVFRSYEANWDCRCN